MTSPAMTRNCPMELALTSVALLNDAQPRHIFRSGSSDATGNILVGTALVEFRESGWNEVDWLASRVFPSLPSGGNRDIAEPALVLWMTPEWKSATDQITLRAVATEVTQRWLNFQGGELTSQSESAADAAAPLCLHPRSPVLFLLSHKDRSRLVHLVDVVTTEVQAVVDDVVAAVGVIEMGSRNSEGISHAEQLASGDANSQKQSDDQKRPVSMAIILGVWWNWPDDVERDEALVVSAAEDEAPLNQLAWRRALQEAGLSLNDHIIKSTFAFPVPFPLDAVRRQLVHRLTALAKSRSLRVAGVPAGIDSLLPICQLLDFEDTPEIMRFLAAMAAGLDHDVPNRVTAEADKTILTRESLVQSLVAAPELWIVPVNARMLRRLATLWELRCTPAEATHPSTAAETMALLIHQDQTALQTLLEAGAFHAVGRGKELRDGKEVTTALSETQIAETAKRWRKESLFFEQLFDKVAFPLLATELSEFKRLVGTSPLLEGKAPRTLIYWTTPGSPPELIRSAVPAPRWNWPQRLKELTGPLDIEVSMANLSELYSSYVGETEAHIRRLFRTAAREIRSSAAPDRRPRAVILILSGLELVGMATSKGGDRHTTDSGLRRSLLATLLLCLDGIDTDVLPGSQVAPVAVVGLLGAGTLPGQLEESLVRPGRFDTWLPLSSPTGSAAQQDDGNLGDT